VVILICFVSRDLHKTFSGGENFMAKTRIFLNGFVFGKFLPEKG
jgi:hypothetical protein